MVTMLASILDLRSSFMLAALFVTWVAVVLLMLVVGNLRARLYRLEQAGFAAREGTPYGQLLGKQLGELVGELPSAPRVLFFLSANCASCKRVLGELAARSWASPPGVVWTDHAPAPSPALPPEAIVLDEGPRISKALGIRVTPFVIITSEDGRISKASPINSLSSLGNLAGDLVDAPPAYSHNELVKEALS
jgi:hypothetical protein